MMKDFSTIQAELAQPFAPQDLEWRVQHANKEKTWGLAVPYVTSRAIQDRLDAVVGAQNWRNEFQPWQGGKKGAQICGISIYVEERKEWITKWDGAENTNIEAVKGGLSDSMKRAAVQWGIGRVLYKLPTIWVRVEPRGESCIIPDNGRPNLDGFYMEALKRMNLVPAAPGGLQSQLTGMPGSDPSSQGSPGQGAARRDTQSHPAAAGNRPQNTESDRAQGGGTDFPVFTVQNLKVMPGIERATTRLMLRNNSDGVLHDVFLNGVDQRLVVGASLTKVKISERNRDNVTFLTLDAYEVLPQSMAA